MERPNTETYNHPTYKGWLVLFLLQMIVSSTVSIAYFIHNFDVTEHYNNNTILYAGDLCFYIMLVCLSFYTLYLFMKHKSNAIFMGKIYTVVCFLTNIVSLLTNGMNDINTISILDVIRSMIWQIIWFSYLTFSKQVNSHFPKEYRHIGAFDYIIPIIVVFIPLSIISVGVLKNYDTTTDIEETESIDKSKLKENELTDGMIVFTCPDNFIATEKQEKDTRYYEVVNNKENPTSTTTIRSYYVTAEGQSEMEKYIESCKAQLQCFAIPEVLYDKPYMINGHECRMITYKFEDETETFYYDNAIILDKETNKACLMLCKYHNLLDSPVMEIADKIRFKE